MSACKNCLTFIADDGLHLCMLCANKGNFPPEFNANALPELGEFTVKSSKPVGYIHYPAELELPKTSGGKSKYHVEILPDVWVDVYDVLNGFGPIDPAYAHAIKKMLKTGKRGHKSEAEDRKDILASVVRSNERFDLFNNNGEKDAK